MHAPQSVIYAHDALTDLVLEIVVDGRKIEWATFRELAIELMNKIREDIGIRTEPIVYRGTR